jgi:cytochrome c oxidase subunit IV
MGTSSSKWSLVLIRVMAQATKLVEVAMIMAVEPIMVMVLITVRAVVVKTSKLSKTLWLS